MGGDLTDRASRILATLVRQYIETGEPVASQLVAQRGALGVSSATVRNILARLEDSGFVRQPHTSAGRVPTDRGYRFYVDLLLETRRPARRGPAIETRLRRAAGDHVTLEGVLERVSHELSQESHHLGFALAPASEEAALQRIEFVALSGSRVLVVLVARGGRVSQKIVDAGDVVTPDDLRRAADYVNREFAGLPLERVRAALLERMHEARRLYDRLVAQGLALAHEALADRPDPPRLFVEGAASLIDEAAAAHGELPLVTLRLLVQMIEEKQRLVKLLGEYLDGPGLTVVIGAEHASPQLRSFSLVAATYSDGSRTGSVGVIGPTRMRYLRAIDAVDGAARAVTDILHEAH